MKLGTKTIMTLGVAMTVLFLALYVVSNQIVRKGFSQLEERYARRSVDRALQTIKEQGDHLDTSVADWATWDDMYTFVQDRNAAFIESSLTPNACKILKIQAMLIVDVSGKVVWAASYDLEESRKMPVPAGLLRLAGTGSPLTRFGPDRDRVSGLVLLDEGPMIVAARPILTSNNEGPARGTVIMGCYLDAAETQRLADALQLKLSIFRTDTLPDRPLLAATLAALSSGEPSAIRVLNTTTLAGYGLLRDLDAKPAVMIEVEMPRDIFAQGLQTTFLFTGMLVLVGAFFSVVVVVMLRWQIITRLEHLSRDIGRISMTEDFSQRVLLPGSDELSAVAHGINRLLAGVGESRLALVKSEERFRQIAESVVDGIWEVDVAGLYTYASPAMAQVLGYKAEDLVGQKHFYDLFTPEERESLKKTALDVIARKEPFRGLVSANVHKDGRVVVLETNATPVLDANGTLLGYRGADRDITERKRAEGEIQKLNSELEQRVWERTTQLEAMVKELESFSYSVSHDLRTPLRTIDGFSQTVLEDYGDKMGEDGKESLGRIREAAQKMSRLIDDMQALSRLARRDMQLEPVDLSGVAWEVVNDLRLQDPARAAEFVIAEGVTVRGDGRLLQMVMQNLLANAWKFTRKQSQAKIEFGAVSNQEKNGQKVFFVRDNGAGFETAYVDKLFKPFERLHTENEFAGSGIGLVIVKRIVERHGGKVWAEGEVGKGAAFYFAI